MSARIVLAVALVVSGAAKLARLSSPGVEFFWTLGLFWDAQGIAALLRGAGVAEILAAGLLLAGRVPRLVAVACAAAFAAAIAAKIWVLAVDPSALADCGCLGALSVHVPWSAALAVDAVLASVAAAAALPLRRGKGDDRRASPEPAPAGDGPGGTAPVRSPVSAPGPLW